MDNKSIGAILCTMNHNNAEINALSSRNDAFSQVLQLLKLDVDIYHNAKVCGNWRIDEHSIGATCFHIVTVGRCLLDVPGHFNGVLECGDLVIFPRELPHHMQPLTALSGEQRHLDYNAAESMDGTGLLCGEVCFQHKGYRYLLDALPPVFIIRCHESAGWLKSLLDMIVLENRQTGPASKVILNRLSELLFTYAVRQHLTANPKEVGFLALYGHPRLANAINAVHQAPEKNWTLEIMAEQAASSRSSFAETFKKVSGWTVGQYLSWWRMQLAWSLLSEGSSVSQVAAKVGYKSESAFSRAFKNEFLISAGKVRRGEEQAA